MKNFLFLISLCFFYACSLNDDLINLEDESETEITSVFTRSSVLGYQGEGVYHIKIVGGIKNDRLYLSTNKDGSKVNLWHEDDGSGRQKWWIRRHYDGFRIEVYSGVSGDRRHLSYTTDGKHVRLHNVLENYSSSFRQKFNLAKVPGQYYYNIINMGYLSSDRHFLSSEKDGSECIGWYDDGSYREKWYLEKIND